MRADAWPYAGRCLAASSGRYSLNSIRGLPTQRLGMDGPRQRRSFFRLAKAVLPLVKLRLTSPPLIAKIRPDRRSERFHSSGSLRHPAFYRYRESYPRRNVFDVLVSFARLAVGLQAIAHAAQKIANDGWRDIVPLLRQLAHKVAQAAARPQQSAHRVASGGWRNQTLEIDHEGWILDCLPLAPTALLADSPRRN